MATLKFRVTASFENLALRELRRAIPEEITVESQTAIDEGRYTKIVISTPADQWSAKARYVFDVQNRNRAIRILKG